MGLKLGPESKQQSLVSEHPSSPTAKIQNSHVCG